MTMLRSTAADSTGQPEAAEPTEQPPASPRRPESTSAAASATTVLEIIAGLMVIGGLKLATPVALPLALSVLLLALVWPLQKRLQSTLSQSASVAVTIALLLIVTAAFVSGLVMASDMIGSRLPDYAESVQEKYLSVLDWARDHDWPYEPSRADFRDVMRQALGMFSYGIQTTYPFIGQLVLAALFLVFALVEIPIVYKKLESLPEESPGAKLLKASNSIARQYREYMWTKTFTSALTGALTWIFGWVVGLDLAFVWGFLAFFLNFIPTLGSIVAVVPPTVFAFLQFGGAGPAIAVLAGLTAIQLMIGSYLDPWLQAKNLKLSPFVVLLSIVFWGWVWGVVGALVGVPMTVGVIAVCRQYERTAWVAAMFADVPVPAAEVESA